MNYPIRNKFSQNTINKIKQLVENTIETGEEHGILLCSNHEITDSGFTCTGHECVDIQGVCSLPLHKQGYFHTHPKVKKIVDELKSSEIWELLKNEVDFYVKKSLKEDPSSFSAGDLAVVLHSLYYKVDGTTCIVDDRLPDIMQCYTLKKKPSDFDIGRLIHIYGNSTGKPPKELLKYFEHEIVSLSGKQLYKDESKYQPKSKRR